MEKEKGLIFALDLIDKKKALETVSEVEPYIDAVKINYPLVLSQGLKFISKLPKPLIADLKVADIPSINRSICKLVDPFADSIICHAFPGEDSVKSCVENFSGETYAVVEMSHPGAEKIFKSFKKDLLKIAASAGVDGVIAPATRPKSIKAINRETNLKIFSPGVGAQGGKIEDTLKAGADFLIIGRTIYGSKDPKKVAKSIASRIREFSNDK